MNRVLVVDNNEDWLTWLGDALTEAGCDVLTTWSGVEALGLVVSKSFDAVIVDDYLPDLYIGEFLARLAALPERPRIILMRSAVAENGIIGQHRIRVVDKGRTGVLVKAVMSISADETEPEDLPN